jgi:hypothetical protein
MNECFIGIELKSLFNYREKLCLLLEYLAATVESINHRRQTSSRQSDRQFASNARLIGRLQSLGASSRARAPLLFVFGGVLIRSNNAEPTMPQSHSLAYPKWLTKLHRTQFLDSYFRGHDCAFASVRGELCGNCVMPSSDRLC